MNLQSAMVHSSTVYTQWWNLRPADDVIVGLPRSSTSRDSLQDSVPTS